MTKANKKLLWTERKKNLTQNDCANVNQDAAWFECVWFSISMWSKIFGKFWCEIVTLLKNCKIYSFWQLNLFGLKRWSVCMLITCCSSLKNVKPWMSAALLVNLLDFFPGWQLILTVVGSVFGAIIIVVTSALSVMAHKWVYPVSVSTHSVVSAVSFSWLTFLTPRVLRSNKRTKLSDDADPKKPYVTTAAAASAFVNIQLPRIPRATTKSSLGLRSNLGVNTRDSWHNFAPTEEDVVSACGSWGEWHRAVQLEVTKHVSL